MGLGSVAEPLARLAEGIAPFVILAATVMVASSLATWRGSGSNQRSSAAWMGVAGDPFLFFDQHFPWYSMWTHPFAWILPGMARSGVLLSSVALSLWSIPGASSAASTDESSGSSMRACGDRAGAVEGDHHGPGTQDGAEDVLQREQRDHGRRRSSDSGDPRSPEVAGCRRSLGTRAPDEASPSARRSLWERGSFPLESLREPKIEVASPIA